MKASNLLTKLNACPEIVIWASDKSIQEFWNTCHRGDWMLWFYQKSYPQNIRELTLAKAKCAETVSHLMSPASLAAIEVATAFAYGSASIEALDKAARTAFVAAPAYDVTEAFVDCTDDTEEVADAAANAAYAAASDSIEAHVVASAVARAAAYATTVFAYDRVYAEVEAKTANICRKYLTLESTYS